jgi:hypothetical protein
MPDTPKVVILNYAKIDGQDTLLPEGGNPIPVLENEKVVFVPGNEGAKNLTVTFTRKSPFGDGSEHITINAGETFKIARAKSPNSAENKFPFDCRVFIGGVPITSVGGGELEIDPGGG